MNLKRTTLLIPLVALMALGTIHCSSDPESAGTAGATSQAGTNATSGSVSGSSSGGVSGAPSSAGGMSGGTTAGTATRGGGAGTAGGGAATTGGGGASAGTTSATAGSGGTSGGSAATGGSGGASGGGASGGSGGSGGGGSFTLTSSKLAPGAMFPTAYTCASGTAGTSLPLTWTAGPSGTLSYALILQDTNNNLNHWVVWDIPPATMMLPEGLPTDAMLTTPAGAKQKSAQGAGYLGPCPSGMSHTYKFTIYAMDVATLPGAMTSMMTSDLAAAVQMHDLASATLSGVSDAKKP